MPWGACQQKSPVPKPIMLKVVGNIWGQPKCWDWWFLPTVLGRQDGIGWSLRLATAWTRGFGMPTHTWPMGPGILNWGGNALASRECEDDSDQPKPSLEDSNKWNLWHTCRVETPSWWPDLWEVPNQTNIPQFARRAQALFQMPKARCHASKMENDYLVLPAPHCIERDMFLPFNNMQFSGQYYHI